MTLAAESAILHDRRAAIAAMGTTLSPEVLAQSRALFADEQRALAGPDATATDLAYGPHPRQCLDIYAPEGATSAPVLVWVHGGGFLRGGKSDPTHPFEAHIGHFAARNGMVGVVINYRLVPDARYPSGAEDLALAVEWLRANIAAYGGDPARIALAGTSAGACHVATCLARGGAGVRVAVLLSGLYGVTPLDERDRAYFGAGEAEFISGKPLAAMLAGAVPLFVACAEFDPPRFQAEALGLWQAHHAARGALPRGHIASGHNHFTMSLHIGGADSRLADEVRGFLTEHLA